jgi:GNAT superfamily N-acetyltransferase
VTTALQREQSVDIRLASPDDAASIADLSGELGYPVDVDTMRHRLERLTNRDAHAVFVAHRDGRIVGWIDVAIVQHVQAEARAEIGGLVVAADVRSLGIGAQLVARAELWAADQGMATIVVRSQIKREAAHRFYEREGYARTKTSAVFTKPLSRG